ncbi:hypothetical protein ACRALDRAFT_1052743 [Sodiomyces alcalophilus JCM 7366]|uniref:uncharacterized protein n=1 Tax=Sodiomyces alcalophilus JCM 7366 TaxID=591952 RepID=UPI0039B4550A
MSSQPPYGYYGQPGPGGSPPAGYPQQPPPAGQPPYQQQPYHYGPPTGTAPTGGPGQPPPPTQYPSGPGAIPPQDYQHGQPYPNQPYPQQQPQQQHPYYGQQPPPQGQSPMPPYGHQQAPYGSVPPQQPGAYGQFHQPPPGQPQHHQPPPPQSWTQGPVPPQGAFYGAPAQGVQPTPASSGYDPAQKAWVQPVDTSSDIEGLRKAMKGIGCDEKSLIRILTSPKYANPWAMAQLVRDYNSRFIRDLAKDIESETRGDLETTLLALLRGPLENDARILDKAINRMGTDEDALNDVLLCRSNADLRAIQTEYRRIRNRDLLVDIKGDVNDTMFRLYSMLLAGTRPEDAAPVLPHDIDAKVTELQRATEGTIGVNAIAVAQVFASSSNPQIAAMIDAYRRKYHRDLHQVIAKEFRGDMEDALLRMLQISENRAAADADRLREALTKGKTRLFANRVVTLYWDRSRLDAAKAAYKSKHGRPFAKDVKEVLGGDFEDVILALVADK